MRKVSRRYKQTDFSFRKGKMCVDHPRPQSLKAS